MDELDELIEDFEWRASLEKEDWADTVNCVMNMPFMKGEEK